MPIRVVETSIHEARVFYPDVFADERGFFKEVFSSEKYRALGLTDEFVQDNVSFSKRNVIRGLHCDPEMSKFVQVLRGQVFDVIFDFRRSSPTFRKWQSFDLSEQNHAQLYVPKGCLHGFLALTEDVVFTYKFGAYYNPEREFAVRWNDAELGIEWPAVEEPNISVKDRAAITLREALRRHPIE